MNLKIIKLRVAANINAMFNENVLHHERFAHQNKRHVQSLLKRDLGIQIKSGSEFYEGSFYRAGYIIKFEIRDRADGPAKQLHADVCGLLLILIRLPVLYSAQR